MDKTQNYRNLEDRTLEFAKRTIMGKRMTGLLKETQELRNILSSIIGKSR